MGICEEKEEMKEATALNYFIGMVVGFQIAMWVGVCCKKLRGKFLGIIVLLFMSGCFVFGFIMSQEAMNAPNYKSFRRTDGHWTTKDLITIGAALLALAIISYFIFREKKPKPTPLKDSGYYHAEKFKYWKKK